MKKLFNKNFILLWQGSAISNIGNVLYSIAIGIWVFDKTGSTTLMGVMGSISYFCSLFLAPISGAFVDRINRKYIIVLTDLIRGIAMLIIAYFAMNNQLEVYMVLIVALIAGFCNVMFAPAISTVIVNIVDTSEIVRAQSITQGTFSLIQLIGSAISGTLIVTFGVGFMIFINGLSFIISAISECFIDIPRQKGEGVKVDGSLILSDMKIAFKYVVNTNSILLIMIFAFLINLLGSGMGSMLYPFVLTKGFTLNQYSIFIALESAASLIGVMLVSTFKIPSNKKTMIFRVTMILSGIFNLLMILSTNFIIMNANNVIFILLNTIFNALFNAMIVVSIDESVRGKVFGLFQSFSMGGVGLSSILYGFIADIINPVNTALLLSLIAFVISIIFVNNKSIIKAVDNFSKME